MEMLQEPRGSIAANHCFRTQGYGLIYFPKLNISGLKRTKQSNLPEELPEGISAA